MRVVTFNVGCQELGHFVSQMVADEVLSSAEVVFLQEIEEYHKTAEVRETLSHFGFYHFAASRSLKKGDHGLAILSKHKINDYEVIELPSYDLRLRSRKRIAVKGFIEASGQKIQLCNIHLDSRLNIHDRISQITPLIEIINKSHDKTIIGGDFNTIPFRLFKNILPFGLHNQSHHLAKFLNEQGFETFAKQPRYSMRLRGVRWLLDYIYVRNLKIIDYAIRDTIVTSDHFPIWADIETV